MRTCSAPGGRRRAPYRTACRSPPVSTTRCSGRAVCLLVRCARRLRASTCSLLMVPPPAGRSSPRGSQSTACARGCRRSRVRTPRIVFAGRLHPEKGPDLLLDALARLAAPPPTFVLGAGAMEAELRRRAAGLGIERHVHLVGWRDDPASWIAGASVCVVPSRFDAWSQTAALAMSLGVPVIGTAVEGLPGVLGDGRGVLVAPEDPAALADAIEGVLSGRLRTDVRAAGLYARGFTPGAVAARYAVAYRALCATRGAVRAAAAT